MNRFFGSLSDFTGRLCFRIEFCDVFGRLNCSLYSYISYFLTRTISAFVGGPGVCALAGVTGRGVLGFADRHDACKSPNQFEAALF